MADPSTMEVHATLKTEVRDVEIEKLLKISKIILSKVGTVNYSIIIQQLRDGLIDIELSDELSGILMTLFTCLHKEENDNAGHLRYKSYSAKLIGIEIAIQELVEEVKKEKIELDFLIATPIVEWMTLFKGFFSEVRTGLTRFPVRASVAKKYITRDAQDMPLPAERGHRELTQNISQYGLTHHHVPLLQGLTLAPKKRKEVIPSLGPLTQAILLVLEESHNSKLSNALLNSLQKLPMAREIINCLEENSPASCMRVLRELGDILLLTTARATQKICFPLLLIMHMWERKPADFKWSFSGAPMLKLYNLAVADGARASIKSGADEHKTAEVLFHSMFGTYLADLSILSQITSHQEKWHQRKELNAVFYKRASQITIEVPLITFKYVSKMDQSLLTNSSGSFAAQVTSRPSFSGFRKRCFTESFLAYLTTGTTSRIFSSEPMQLMYALKKTKDALKEDKDRGMLPASETKWEEHRGGEWVDCHFMPVEDNIKFYG